MSRGSFTPRASLSFITSSNFSNGPNSSSSPPSSLPPPSPSPLPPPPNESPPSPPSFPPPEPSIFGSKTIAFTSVKSPFFPATEVVSDPAQLRWKRRLRDGKWCEATSFNEFVSSEWGLGFCRHCRGTLPSEAELETTAFARWACDGGVQIPPNINRGPSGCSLLHSTSLDLLRNREMADDIRFFRLNTGSKIPSVGLGTWQSSPGLVGDAVAAAIKAGYRHIDCAQRYGNEKEIGLVLKKLFEDGVVKREDLFITSKLWCTDHAPEDVLVAMDRTLRDLQLDYVDLYLMHWPVRLKKGSASFDPENLVQPDIPCTWRAMETLYDSGKARAIGVSNFSTKKLSDLLDVAHIPPAAVQVECHPSWQQGKLHSFCKSKGVHLQGYSPLGSPGTSWIKGDVLQNPILLMVAEKLGKTPAQVALRWGLQMGHSVLPKSTNETRIKENFNVFGWSIPEDLFAQLSEIQQARLVRGTQFVHDTYGAYRTLEELWDGEI